MVNPLVALLTDFGERGFFAASLKAVIAGINPAARTIDISHRVPAFDVRAAGVILDSCCRFFPRDTIFLSVVDPGVGTKRRILLVRTGRYAFIAPDNGLLTLALEHERVVEIRTISSPRYFLTPERTTFEGRDRMAPAAAWLSLGVAPREFGPRLRKYAVADVPRPSAGPSGIRGAVLYADHFGNLITNIPGRMLDEFRGKAGAGGAALRIAGRAIRSFRTSYDSPERGEPFVLVNGQGLVEIAVREASAADLLGAGPGCAVGISAENRT